jgi:ppGpp synthetase/RelA/SpoT-type nucleotidyltranferase
MDAKPAFGDGPRDDQLKRPELTDRVPPSPDRDRPRSDTSDDTVTRLQYLSRQARRGADDSQSPTDRHTGQPERPLQESSSESTPVCDVDAGPEETSTDSAEKVLSPKAPTVRTQAVEPGGSTTSDDREVRETPESPRAEPVGTREADSSGTDESQPNGRLSEDRETDRPVRRPDGDLAVAGSRDDGRTDQAEAARDVRHALAERHPDVADVVSRLVADEAHPLDVVRSLADRERRPRALATIRELADERLLADRGLDDFTAEHPGRGPLFAPVPRELNHHEDDISRKATYILACKSLDAARTVGSDPSPMDRRLVDDYSSRLIDEVASRVSLEVGELAREVDGTRSIRAKDADGLLDKVNRMTDGAGGRSARVDYQVGDVIDAVGARITVADTERLEYLLSGVKERFGVGDDGRILEMENMYAEPKPHNPSYRVVPLVIAVEVNRMPYTFELQLCTWRASIASDLEHNTLYKPYIRPTRAQQERVRRMQAEAAALDQDETRSRWHD